MVAPATQQSGASASITSRGVKLQKLTDRIYSVTGRPADAVRIGLGVVFKDNKPDLVISGLNFGQNSGQEVMVSGTVGAAATAHVLGYPAIAISVEIKFSEMTERFPSTLKAMPAAAGFIVELLAANVKLPDNAILNINYPAVPRHQIKGVVSTTGANYSLFDGTYQTEADGSLRPNFDLTPPQGSGTDAYELSQGFVTVTRLDGSYSLSVNRRLKRLAKALDKSFVATE
jgi:5'-nucleotidase